jgi:hypothetical protein
MAIFEVTITEGHLDFIRKSQKEIFLSRFRLICLGV